MNIFELIFLQPLFNLLVFFYNIVPGNDMSLAIVLVTIVLKFVLLPFTVRMLKAQKGLQQLQPKLQALQKKHKGDREALGRATMELYKKEKINPFSSCLPLLIQLPFLFAIFRVFRDGFESEKLDTLYSFVSNPGSLNPVSFGINLADPFIPFAVLAGLAQFWQTKMLIQDKQPKIPGAKDEGMATAMNKQMMYFMPIITVIIGATLPGGLSLYWFVFTLLTVLQQYMVFKPKDKNSDIIEGEIVSGNK
jgi:YidC/Oxa1 family membrane protein insertase